MTVGELIAQLEYFDPSTLVLVNGYEGGYDHAQPLRGQAVARTIPQAWYHGTFDDVDRSVDLHTIQTVVIIARGKHYGSL